MTSQQDRVHSLYESVLQPRLAALEDLRLSTRSYIVKAATLIGPPAALFMFRGVIGSILPSTLSPYVGPAGIAGIVIGAVLAAKWYLLPGMTAYANYLARLDHPEDPPGIVTWPRLAGAVNI